MYELDSYYTLFFPRVQHNNKNEHSGGVSCTDCAYNICKSISCFRYSMDVCKIIYAYWKTKETQGLIIVVPFPFPTFLQCITGQQNSSLLKDLFEDVAISKTSPKLNPSFRIMPCFVWFSKAQICKPSPVVRSEEGASALHADGRGFDPQVRQHFFVKICHEIISTAILSLPPVVSYWRKDVHLVLVWLTAWETCPGTVWLGGT